MHDGSTSTVMRLTTDATAVKTISDALAERFDDGQVAVSAFEEPDGRWSLAVHFSEPPDQAAMRALIASAADASVDNLAFETLVPTDWVRKGLEGLTPVEAGRFVVHGAHARGRVRPNQIAIEIEAALAFGTGHHGTTRGCLLALDRIIKARRRSRAPSRKRGKETLVLDVGTGTGVLAIAAARALHRRVLASDVDARAVMIARENVQHNRAGRYVEIMHRAGLGARRFQQRAPYELVLANILLEPLQRLATPMARLIARNGYVVLSGLLLSQAGPALASYRSRGLVLVRRIRLEGWMTLVLRRPRQRSSRPA